MRFDSYINSTASPNGVRFDFEMDVTVEYDEPITERQWSRKLELTSVIDSERPNVELLDTLSDYDRGRLEEEAYEHWQENRRGGGRDQAERENEMDARRDARNR